MKTQSRSHVSDHASSSQVRARCSANPQARVEHRPFQRQVIREPFVNYEQQRREMYQRANSPYQKPSGREDLRPLLKVIPACPNFDFMFGTRILIRGSPEYF